MQGPSGTNAKQNIIANAFLTHPCIEINAASRLRESAPTLHTDYEVDEPIIAHMIITSEAGYSGAISHAIITI
jgi:hypothetical protein